ncbi:carbohydrate-binding domain-containing protein [Acetobacterium tundrae]|uniref:Carbohydrate-binding domain-containing protein n=1 Tax=Acetobacterium tundrae TaxID=132932 RepID=A0ABR6WQ40_9FIRM|nr:carbohydrate-binding domain-containing protein [Acetobacterium tundrae]MBC3798237.1 carbohydrate-binding domain-containing protein [Acetobacterium tundrae]
MLGDNDKIQIVMNGVTINCADYAPIYIKSADKVFVTLNQNTVNTLTDSAEYVQTVEIPLTGVVTSNGQTGMGDPGHGGAQPQQ